MQDASALPQFEKAQARQGRRGYAGGDHGSRRRLTTIPALMAGIAPTVVDLGTWMPAVATLLAAWACLPPWRRSAGWPSRRALVWGGVLFDAVGYKFVFGASAVLLLLSALLTLAASNARPRS